MKMLLNVVKRNALYWLIAYQLIGMGVYQLEVDLNEPLPTADGSGTYADFVHDLVTGAPGMRPSDMGWKAWGFQMDYLTYPYICIILGCITMLVWFRRWRSNHIKANLPQVHKVQTVKTDDTWPPPPKV